MKKIIFFIFLLTPFCVYAKKGFAPIIFDPSKEIVFGQSAFLEEGSLQLYGELIRNAILARFNRVNEQGGIANKKLRLISLNDNGEPQKTNENISYMLDNNVTMFLGNTGTRGIFKILPLITSNKIAVFFPWGGDEKLRKPELKNLVNGSGLIKPQIEALVSHAVNVLNIKKIAIFHDDGNFGLDNKKTAIKLLAQKNITPVKTASYNRFTMDIETPAKKLIKADPKIILCLATSMPTVKLINKFFEHGHYGTKFIGIDSTMFVGDILKRKGVSFSYASPIPNPKTSNLKIVKEFREDIKKYFPSDPLNILSLAYYIHTATVIEGLKKIKGTITKEKLLTQIESMKNYNLSGFTIDFNSNTRHAYPHNIKLLK